MMPLLEIAAGLLLDSAVLAMGTSKDLGLLDVAGVVQSYRPCPYMYLVLKSSSLHWFGTGES